LKKRGEIWNLAQRATPRQQGEDGKVLLRENPSSAEQDQEGKRKRTEMCLPTLICKEGEILLSKEARGERGGKYSKRLFKGA